MPKCCCSGTLHCEWVSVGFNGFFMACREVILNESCRGSGRTGTRFLRMTSMLCLFTRLYATPSLGFWLDVVTHGSWFPTRKNHTKFQLGNSEFGFSKLRKWCQIDMAAHILNIHIYTSSSIQANADLEQGCQTQILPKAHQHFCAILWGNY